MTTGALIFAFNNKEIDYVSLARWCAGNVRRHLGIPVCLVTDSQDQDLSGFDQAICIGPVSLGIANQRYFSDYNTNVVWHNTTRSDVYNLTPWERTLVLDADYVVASDQLKLLLDADLDFLAHKDGYDVTGLNNFEDLNSFGRNWMPMWWATVMMFRKSKQAELIFSTMQMVRDNWQHYRNLYGISQSTFRNDFALSIALGIVNGHTLDHPSIPWNLASLTPDQKLTQLDTDRYRVEFVTPDNKSRYIELHQDFHAMGKKQLGEIVANQS
jgi:hypothetical protein